MARDVCIGKVSAGTYNRSGTTTGVDTYKIIMPARGTRTGFTIENTSANNETVRLGLTGPEYVILPFGSLSRTNEVGSVWMGDIYIKSAAGGDAFAAEEN